MVAMKKWIVLIFVLIFSSIAEKLDTQQTKIIKKVISNMKYKKTIDILSIGKDQTLFNRIIRNLVSTPEQSSFQVSKLKINRRVKFMNSSIVVLVDSASSLGKINLLQQAVDIKPRPVKIFVVCPGLTFKMLEAEIEQLEHFQFTSYLIRENGTWTIYGIFQLFIRAEKTKVTKVLRELNSMNNKSKRWIKKIFFPQPTKNFRGYKFQFRVFPVTNIQMWISKKPKRNEKRTYQAYGVNIDIIKTLGEIHNFTQTFNPIKQYKPIFPWEKDYVNLVYKPINAFKGETYYRNITIMTPYESEYLRFVAPPGELYTGYEKLLIAFDHVTWMWIVITFSCAFLTIFVLSFASKKAQGIVFGSRVRSPSLNVIVAFFGLGQMTLPRRNFGRFLLMCFILYSLIIRTAYQGVSFNFLQKEVRKGTIQTVDEAIAKNFTIYGQVKFLLYWRDTDLAKERVVKLNEGPDVMLEEIIKDAREKSIVIASDSEIDAALYKLHGRKKAHLLSENCVVETSVMGFQKDHPLYQIFDRQLKRLIETGFVSHWLEKYKNLQVKPRETPKVLTMTTLSAGFKVWLYALATSLICFVSEIAFANRLKILKLLVSPLVFIVSKSILKKVITLK